MRKFLLIIIAMVMLLPTVAFGASNGWGPDIGAPDMWSEENREYWSAKIEVVPFVRQNTGVGEFKYVADECAGAIVHERVYYAIKLTVSDHVYDAWWDAAHINVSHENVSGADISKTPLKSFPLGSGSETMSYNNVKGGGVYWLAHGGTSVQEMEATNNYFEKAADNFDFGAKNIYSATVNSPNPKICAKLDSKWEITADTWNSMHPLRIKKYTLYFEENSNIKTITVQKNNDTVALILGANNMLTQANVTIAGNEIKEYTAIPSSVNPCSEDVLLTEVFATLGINFGDTLNEESITNNFGFHDAVAHCFSYNAQDLTPTPELNPAYCTTENPYMILDNGDALEKADFKLYTFNEDGGFYEQTDDYTVSLEKYVNTDNNTANYRLKFEGSTAFDSVGYFAVTAKNTNALESAFAKFTVNGEGSPDVDGAVTEQGTIGGSLDGTSSGDNKPEDIIAFGPVNNTDPGTIPNIEIEEIPEDEYTNKGKEGDNRHKPYDEMQNHANKNEQFIGAYQIDINGGLVKEGKHMRVRFKFDEEFSGKWVLILHYCKKHGRVEEWKIKIDDEGYAVIDNVDSFSPFAVYSTTEDITRVELNFEVSDGNNGSKIIPATDIAACRFDEEKKEATVYINQEPAWLYDDNHDVNFIRLRAVIGMPSDSNVKSVGVRWAGNQEIDGPIMLDDYGTFNLGGMRHDEPQTSGIHEVELTWYTDYSGQELLSRERFTFRIISVYESVLVPAERIMVDEDIEGASNDIGMAIYPRDVIGNSTTSVNTSLSVYDGADSYSYSINGGTDSDKIQCSGAINLDVTVSDSLQTQQYTIKWYDESDCLIAIEDLIVSFPQYEKLFTSFEGDIYIDDLEGVEQTIVTGAGKTPSITLNCDLDAEKWKEALDKSISVESVEAMVYFTLPENAVSVAIIGTGEDNPDEMAMGFILSEPYYPLGSSSWDNSKRVNNTITLGDVNYSGANAVINPRTSGVPSFLLKWRDTSGVEHFHRIPVAVNHATDKPVILRDAAIDLSRIQPNIGGATGVKWSMEDAVVTYYIDTRDAGPGDGNNMDKDPEGNFILPIFTKIARPGSEAVKAEYRYDNWFYEENNIEDGLVIDVGYALVDADVARYHLHTVCISWKDKDNNIICTENLMIYVLPRYAGVWMDDDWAPAPEAGLSKTDPTVTDHLKYDAVNGHWSFVLDSTKPVDTETFTTAAPIFYMPAPSGATHYRISIWESGMYDYYRAIAVRNEMENGPYNPLEAEDTDWYYYGQNGKVYFTFGWLCKFIEAGNSSLKLLTSQDTPKGNSHSVHIQWYDANGNLIPVEGGKKGHFIYLTVEPQMVETVAKDKDFTEDDTADAVDQPTAIAPDAGQWKLEFHRPPQTDEKGSDRQWYEMYNMTMYDPDGIPYQPGEDNPGVVYIPYPKDPFTGEQITYETALEKNWKFKLTHYDNEEMHPSGAKKVKITLTPWGIRAEVDSFSPFLLTFTDTPGDVNYDCSTNDTDAQKILNNMAGVETFTGEQNEIADANGDGAVDLKDVLFICRFAKDEEQ